MANATPDASFDGIYEKLADLSGRLGLLEESVKGLQKDLTELRARYDKRFPPTTNCYHCGKLVSPDAWSCPLCGKRKPEGGWR